MPSTKYLRALHARGRERGLDHEGLRDIAQQRFSADSLSKLSDEQVRKMLTGLGPTSRTSRAARAERRNAQGNHGRRDYDASGDTVQLVSGRERQMLAEAAALRGWSDESLEKFCLRQIKRVAPRTMVEFNKVFWALKSMNRRDGLHE